MPRSANPPLYMRKPARLSPIVPLLAFALSQADWDSTDEMGGIGVGPVYTLAVSGTTLYAGTNFDGVYRSTNGFSWNGASTGLPSKTVFGLAAHENYLFAATYSGLSRSGDRGASWIDIDSGWSGNQVASVAILGNHLFAGSGYGGGIYRSKDNGTNWTIQKAGLGSFPLIFSLGESVPFLYAGGAEGGYRSADHGESWTRMDGLPNRPLQKFLAKDGKLFFASEGEGVFCSLDSGSSWSRANSGLPDKTEVFDLAVAGSDIYAAAGFDGIYRSADDGASWSPVNEGMEPSTDVLSLAVLGPYLYAGCYGGVWRRPLAEMASGSPILPRARTSLVPKTPRDPLRIYDIRGKKAIGHAATGSIFFLKR